MENKPVHSDIEKYSESTENAQPKSVSTRHRVLMRRLLAGIPLGEAAVELGYTVARASVVANSPLFKEEMSKMQEEIKGEFVQCEGSKVQTDYIRERLKEEALESLNTLVALRNTATSERVKQLSAIEILDRAGYKSTDKLQAEVVIDASEGLVNALNRAILEMRTTKTK